jgi:hypothetical protein
LQALAWVFAWVRKIEYLKGLGSQNVDIISRIYGASFNFDPTNVGFPFHPIWVEPMAFEYHGVLTFAKTVIQLVYMLHSSRVMKSI